MEEEVEGLRVEGCGHSARKGGLFDVLDVHSARKGGPLDVLGGRVASVPHSCLMIQCDWEKVFYIYLKDLLLVSDNYEMKKVEEFIYSTCRMFISVLISETCL